MKVLLVSPNIEYLPDPVFPLGLACLAAVLKKNNVEHRILDLCFADDYEMAIESAIDSFSPDIVGLSLRNIDNVSYPNYVSYLPFYCRVIQAIKQRSDATVIIGGSAFALLPDRLLNHLGADFGIRGEGEHSFPALINRLAELKDTRGYTGPRIIGNNGTVIENLDLIPRPDRSGFDNEAYLQWGGMGNIQTKRGCPFKCVYCTYPIVEGRNTRLRSPASVCDEIETMLHQGITNVFVVDNIFNYPMDHAEGICREIIKRRLSISWSCYANPRFVTHGLIDSMLEAGCTSVEFGSDAADDSMLANLGKNFTVDDLASASVICGKSGMPFCHSLLVGGPGETMDSVRQTFNTINELSPTAVICMIGIRVFPETRLSVIAMEEGAIPRDADFLEPVFYLSTRIENEIIPFIERFSQDNPTWIFPGMNINMTPDLQKKLRRFGIKGPLWEYMKRGNRVRQK